MAALLLDTDLDGAQAHAETAVRRAGRVPAAREALGLVAYRQGDWAKALAEFRTVRRLSGSVPPAAARWSTRSARWDVWTGPSSSPPPPRRAPSPVTRGSSWPSSSPGSAATWASSTPPPPGCSCPSSTRAAGRPGARDCSTPTPRRCWPSVTAPAPGSGSAMRSTPTSRSRPTLPSGSTSSTASPSSTCSVTMRVTRTSRRDRRPWLRRSSSATRGRLRPRRRRPPRRPGRPYAVERLLALRIPVVYATNNASLTPQDVADQLARPRPPGRAGERRHELAGRRRLRRHALPAGLPVLAVGGPGRGRRAGRGRAPAASTAATAAWSPCSRATGPNVTAALTSPRPATPSRTARRGWRRTATPPCRPSAASRRATEPCSARWRPPPACSRARPPGKPEPPLYDLSVARLGVPKATEVLAIGDRLDTDILGAMDAGLDSLWVLTGVDDLVSFARSPGRPAPTYAARDLRALDRPPMRAHRRGSGGRCGSVRLSVDWSQRRPHGRGGEDPDDLVAAATAALVHGRDVERSAGRRPGPHRGGGHPAAGLTLAGPAQALGQ